jgi:hypothetical protein
MKTFFTSGIAVERVHPGLAPEARLLEPSERRLNAHRRVGVDREDARVDRAGDAKRPAPSRVQIEPESP